MEHPVSVYTYTCTWYIPHIQCTFGSSPNKSLTTAITRSDFSNTFCSYVYTHVYMNTSKSFDIPQWSMISSLYGRRLTVNDFITSFSCTFPLVFPMELLLWLLAEVKCLTSVNMNDTMSYKNVHAYAQNVHVHVLAMWFVIHSCIDMYMHIYWIHKNGTMYIHQVYLPFAISSSSFLAFSAFFDRIRERRNSYNDGVSCYNDVLLYMFYYIVD